MATPYTREEIEQLGDAFPTRGAFCPRCKAYIPSFADLTAEDETELRKLDFFASMKELRARTGCSLRWAKIWYLHPDGPHTYPYGPSQACPFCGATIGADAKQCLLCKMDWHDSANPIRRGKSIADAILSAAAGSTISIRGSSAYDVAVAYADTNRRDANLQFVIVPLNGKREEATE